MSLAYGANASRVNWPVIWWIIAWPRGPRMAKSAQIDLDAFAEAERDSVTPADFDAVRRQVMTHPARPQTRSENREPAREKLSRRWKFPRR